MTEIMNRTEVAKPCTIENFTVVTFMNPTYFDLEQSYHDIENHKYCFVLDKRKLGVMTEQQKKKAEQVWSLFIPYGYQIKNLNGVNNTLLFEMEDTKGFNPAKEVNICFYDLDHNEILTRQMRWNREHPFNAGTEKFPDEAWEGRKQLYTEWERIGQTLLEK
jgi:hypothetical protein